MVVILDQRTLTKGESTTVQLVSCMTGLDSVVAVNTNNRIFSCLVKSNPVKLETISTSPTLSVLWLEKIGTVQYEEMTHVFRLVTPNIKSDATSAPQTCVCK